ncbi:MAG TPA: ferrochelatase [Steroidobacteraceae bacterium]|nr:ferrochelatase [Steroidobacteraceae bacterium]
MNALPSADDAVDRRGSLDRRDSAVLLVNTGTPAAPRSGAVRRFLSRFLTDPRVIELPRALWLPLLYCVVLPLRSPRSAHRYRLIWRAEGSPLLFYTSQLRAALERELAGARAPLRIEQAFLYSAPEVGQVMEALRAAQVRRLLVLPLFPQASGTTTGAVYDQVARSLARWRTLPELRYVAEYYDEPDYIAALAASVRAHWQQHGRGAHLLLSFHGIPQAYAQRGDRYPDQCRDTAARLAAALELTPQEWTLSFQSRFGANRWLKPATVTTLHELPHRGIRAVTVICPGFAADCLETLEEIALAGRDIFLKAGGERFDYVPALNAEPGQVSGLARLIARVTGDWA